MEGNITTIFFQALTKLIKADDTDKSGITSKLNDQERNDASFIYNHNRKINDERPPK